MCTRKKKRINKVYLYDGSNRFTQLLKNHTCLFFFLFCIFFLISTFYIKLIFSSIKRFIEFPRLELLSMHFFLMRSRFVNLLNVEKKNKLSYHNNIIILTKRIKIDVCVSRPKSAFICPSEFFGRGAAEA
jgi:hypothetical protein